MTRTKRPTGRSRVGRWAGMLRTGLTGIGSVARKQFTIMVVPHSAKPPTSIRLNVVSLLFLLMIAAAVVTLSVYLLPRANESLTAAYEDDGALASTEASLERAEIQVDQLVAVIADLADTMRNVLGDDEENELHSAESDLASLLELDQDGNGPERTIASLRDVTSFLESAQQPLASVSDALELQRQILTDMPTVWPIINGYGYTTMEFGPNIHPITHTWYMHKGIDIAYVRGAPVVATANGVVTDAGFDSVGGYGWFVEITHSYGFSTKYAHLASISVREGQTVAQGETIGLLGNSGISTGPHVHYEIRIGTESIDPSPFLKVSNPNFQRRVHSRK